MTPQAIKSRLRDLLHFTGADTRGAHADPAAGAVDERTHVLQVQIPATLANIMGVTDAMAELRPAPTHITDSCHKTNLIVAVRFGEPQPNAV